MDWLTIDGVPPWDGRYEFDLAGRELTTREWGWIKRLSGYLPLTIDKGLDGADPELFAAFAVIALYRAGKIQGREAGDVFERVADAPFGSGITLESDDQAKDDASPPPQNTSGNGSISGVSSSGSLAPSDEAPTLIGIHGSATSPSPPTTSGT